MWSPWKVPRGLVARGFSVLLCGPTDRHLWGIFRPDRCGIPPSATGKRNLILGVTKESLALHVAAGSRALADLGGA